MTRRDVLARLQEVFDDVFVEEVVVSENLRADDVEEWDSLLQVSLLIAVERAFGIHFTIGEVEATRNVGEFADLILEHVGKK